MVDPYLCRAVSAWLLLIPTAHATSTDLAYLHLMADKVERLSERFKGLNTLELTPNKNYA